MKTGFTLLELLIVIAILAVLAGLVVLTLDPVEMLKKARDVQRMNDLSQLKTSIGLLQAEVTVPNIGSSTCTKILPCSSTGTLAVDGTGWAKIDFTDMVSSPITILPKDPVNDGTNVYYYVASGTDYEFRTKLESDTYSGNMAATSDGGDDESYYEVGTDLTIL